MQGTTSHRSRVLDLLATATLAMADGVLARVWLMGPGDQCDECPMRGECANRTRCLHLEKSAGTTTLTGGPYRRFPLGAREVGRVPETLEAFVANDGLESMGLTDRAWLMAHDVSAFCAIPMIEDGACAGVLAVFARRAIEQRTFDALHAMAALAARALAPQPRPAPSLTTRPASVDAPDVYCLRAWDDIERDVLERVLDHTGGRVSGPQGAAAILDLKPTTLQSRMKKLGVERKRR